MLILSVKLFNWPIRIGVLSGTADSGMIKEIENTNKSVS